MPRLLRFSAPFLLATLVAGGVLVPTLHRAVHAGEGARERAEHRAQGHHHHEAGEGHGLEWTSPCPTPVAPELGCAVCAGVSSHVAAGALALVPPQLTDRAAAPHAAPLRPRRAGAAAIRGPPAA